jgi:hypothetical protein
MTGAMEMIRMGWMKTILVIAAALVGGMRGIKVRDKVGAKMIRKIAREAVKAAVRISSQQEKAFFLVSIRVGTKSEEEIT